MVGCPFFVSLFIVVFNRFIMKRYLSYLIGVLSLLSSCTSQGGIAGDPTAVMLGANIGGLTGAIIGSSNSHTYRGGLVGSLVGTIAGAAIASAATAPNNAVEDVYQVESYPYEGYEGYGEFDDSGIRSYSYSRNRYNTYSQGNSTDLVIRNIRFIDDNKNHIIESEERAKIIFEVVNSGSYAAYHITPVVAEKSGLKHLNISSSVTLECIPAGDGIRYTAFLKAGKLRNGKAIFHVTALDGKGGMIPVREFTIPVQK